MQSLPDGPHKPNASYAVSVAVADGTTQRGAALFSSEVCLRPDAPCRSGRQGIVSLDAQSWRHVAEGWEGSQYRYTTSASRGFVALFDTGTPEASEAGD